MTYAGELCGAATTAVPHLLSVPYAASDTRLLVPASVASLFGIGREVVDMSVGPRVEAFGPFGAAPRTISAPLPMTRHTGISPDGPMCASIAGSPSVQEIAIVVAVLGNACRRGGDVASGLGVAIARGSLFLACFGDGPWLQAFELFEGAFRRGDVALGSAMSRRPFGTPRIDFSVVSRLSDDERASLVAADVGHRIARNDFDDSALFRRLLQAGYAEAELRVSAHVVPLDGAMLGAGFKSRWRCALDIAGLGLPCDGRWATIEEVDDVLARGFRGRSHRAA